MAGIDERVIGDQGDAGTLAAAPSRQQRVIMPSSRHSVLAKADRYRAEPDRVDILVSEPLVAVVHGLHADHTVRETGQGLVCTCERFGRGESTCAHVLAVEHQRSIAASNAAVAEFGAALTLVINPAAAPPGSAGLFANVVLALFDTCVEPDSVRWTQQVTAAAGGQLTLLSLVPPAGGAVALANASEQIHRLVASKWGKDSAPITALPYPGPAEARVSLPATLLVLPVQALGSATGASAWRGLVEHVVRSVRVPLVILPRGFVTRSLRSVLAVVDGSPASANILTAAATLAQATSARVVALHVGTNAPADLIRGAENLPPTGPRAWAEHAAEALRARGIDAVGRAVLGHAAGAIQAIADDINADIVVLGTRAHVARNRPLGSTSRAVLRATERPILLVRPDWVAAGRGYDPDELRELRIRELDDRDAVRSAEPVADAGRRERREDAATSALDIEVEGADAG